MEKDTPSVLDALTSGTRVKRPNIRTKDTPSIHGAQEIIRILETLCQERGAETKYIFFIMSWLYTLKIFFSLSSVCIEVPCPV